MVTLQKGIQAMVIATASIPDWFAQGILRTTLVTSFSALLQGRNTNLESPPLMFGVTFFINVLSVYVVYRATLHHIFCCLRRFLYLSVVFE